ncbi:MAG TPA: MFS transporter [Candidatus Didemnitutus sp.]|jgi:PAT family beta-lactamase induction signal transducer AmpG
MPTPTERRRHPLKWVPSLYFAMGLPNNAAAVSSVIMYKNLGYSNETIALYTSQIYLPWVLKPLWSPFMEPFKTKRWWVLAMEFFMVAAIGAVAFVLPLDGVFRLSLAFFWITGFASATQDIAADAIYMTTLNDSDQARYAGVQGMFWNAGSIVSSGSLVTVTGYLHESMGFDWIKAWVTMMAIVAGLMLLCALWHTRSLPEGEPSHLQGKGLGDAARALRETWVSFFRKDQMILMLVVCFFYRFGEGFIEKFGALFLLDTRAAGGLAFNNQAIGNLYNTLGTVGFIGGTLLGGFFAARYSLRRSFVWLALALNVPHLTYYLLSLWMPQSIGLVGVIVTVEKIGFGFGSVGHILYMMQQMAPGKYKMSHYAFATGVMAGTKWFTGTISGFLFGAVHQNYHAFFLWVLLFSIVPIVLAWFAPFPHRTHEAAAA